MVYSDKMYKNLFILAIVFAVFMRVWGIWDMDIQHDHALNAERALGWFDFLAGKGQTSPIQWFNANPWWGRLSFHDHPPLVFLIQNIFFRIFGQSEFASYLPFALSGIGFSLVMYFALKKLRQKTEALIALFVLSVSSYSIWMTRTGYLEGIETFFILLCFFSLLLYAQSKNHWYLYGWGVAMGLAMLSKYTSIFLLPASLLFLLIWERKIFITKHFWISVGLFVVTLSPVIIYNTEVFIYRGHFDAALSSMVGMHPEDYEVISQRGMSSNIWRNILLIENMLRTSMSLPFFLLSAVSLLHLLYLVVRKRGDGFVNFLVISLFMIFGMFVFAEASTRFLSIAVPFLIMAVAIFIIEASKRIPKKIQIACIACAVGIFAFELFYNFNSNILIKPIGREKVLYSSARFYKHGFKELESYVRNNIFKELGPMRKIHSISELAETGIRGKEVALFDERLDWFSRVWYIQRYQFYYGALFLSFTDISLTVSGKENIFDFLDKAGAKGYWFIVARGDGIVDRENLEYTKMMNDIQKNLEDAGVKPEKEIKDYKGDTVMKMYHFNLVARQ